MIDCIIISTLVISFITNSYINFLIYKRDVAIVNKLIDLAFPITKAIPANIFISKWKSNVSNNFNLISLK